MFNKQDELKDKSTNLPDAAKTNVEKTVSDMKRSAENVGQNFQDAATQSKNEAIGVVNSLKNLLAQYASSTNVNALKEQILDKAYELKGTVSDEVAHAYQAGKDRTVQTVHDKPLTSLGLAIGAGLLLGYILGTKNSSKH